MGSGSKVGWDSSISDFYSDNLSRLRFFEVLGILRVYGFGSCKKGKVPVTSICDPF